VSPAGGTLAVVHFSDQSGQQARLITVKTDGTGYREVYGPFPALITSSVVRWTPEGGSILFVTAKANDDWGLMRISPGGGQPESEGLGFTKLNASISVPPVLTPASLDLNSDGSRLIFGAYTRSAFELWILENVAAALNARR
jgi:hypothetical protein